MDIRDYLFNRDTRQMMYKSLDAGSLRNRAIADNIANVGTPGYKRKEVNFEEQLRKVFEKKLAGTTTNDGHSEISIGADLKQIHPFVFAPQDQTLPGEVNNVDIDMEAAKLAENQIMYNAVMKVVGFDKFNSAITGQPSQ